MKVVCRALGMVLVASWLVACGEEGPAGSFKHGVASGDPLQDAVIIWTRFTPDAAEGGPLADVPVHWQMASDEGLEDVVAEGDTVASLEHDYTVKVDATGLEPGMTYYYRFSVGDQLSPVGRTLTLPEGDLDEVTFAVVSCANYPFGYFNVYRDIAQRDEVEVVLHLGDYLYEYGASEWGKELSGKLNRVPDPPNEIVTLDDYRTRHAQYRTDPDLQAMTARHPLIAVWDDHESSNDSSADEAQNHQPDTEGDWQARKLASAQAYEEWLPIRTPEPDNPIKIYRAFRFGNLASLMMLDTRLIGRAPSLEYFQRGAIPLLSATFDFSDPLNPVPVSEEEAAEAGDNPDLRLVPVPYDMTGDEPQPILDYAKVVEYGRIFQATPFQMPDGISFLPDAEKIKTDIVNDPKRRMLGAEQEEWLREQMEASKEAGIPWQILGQQVLMGSSLMADISEQLEISPEGPWMPNRVRQMKYAVANDLPVNLDSWDGYQAARRDLAKDILEHANNAVVLAGDTHNHFAFDLSLAEGAPPYAVEFGTTSVSSPGMETYFPIDPAFAQKKIMERSREMRYAETSHRGYVLLDVTRKETTAKFMVVDTVLSPDSTEHCDAAFEVDATDGPGVVPMVRVPCN